MEFIIEAIYTRPPAELGGLAPVVVDASEEGDVVSLGLVEQAADELERTVAAVATGSPSVVVLAGSLLTQVPPIERRVRARLDQRWPDAPIAQASSAQAGAVALAIADWRGSAVSERVLQRLRG